MCGRYTLRVEGEELAQAFGLAEVPRLEPRYNVAPSQVMPVVCLGPEGERELVFLRWGLVPSWAKDPSIGNRLVNARAETLAVKPAFRSAFRHRRCLVPASGFFEWRLADGHKQPCHVRMKDARPFALAGLWEHWQPPQGEALRTYTLVTTEANALLREVHDRMPVILAPEDYGRWLDPRVPGAEALLRPSPGEAMTWYPVSLRVNNPRHEGPDCIAPLGHAAR